MEEDGTIRPNERWVEAEPASDASLRFIGTIRTPWKEREECQTQAHDDGPECQLIVDPVWRDALDGLEEYERIEVLYWLDHSRRDLVTQSPRGDGRTGDGYLLSFQGPTSAIECVTALRADAARLGLKSRTGVHTGECEVRGQDLSGLGVNVAARIMDQAEPDQILTSQTVKDLSLGADLEFDSLSARPLRGVPGEWPLFALT